MPLPICKATWTGGRCDRPATIKDLCQAHHLRAHALKKAREERMEAPEARLAVPMSADLLAALKAAAKAEGVKPEVLVRQWIEANLGLSSFRRPRKPSSK